MKRPQWVKIHLIIASFFFPFMILIPMSGALYIYGVKGSKLETVAAESAVVVNPKSSSLEQDVRSFLKSENIDFDFEYIKKRPTYLELRPSTKKHYKVVFSESGTKLIRVQPSLIAAIMEMHKGHGPKLVKQLGGLFGIGLLLVSLSGFWLAYTLKPYRKTFLISFAMGSALLLALLL